MAFIVKRSDGSAGYQVRWQQDRRWQSDIFDTERKAARFKLDVEDAGDRWPAGWVTGVGYVRASGDVGPSSTATPFLDFAEQYLTTRTAVSDYQVSRYRSDIKRLADPFPVVEEIDDQAVATWVRWMLAHGRVAKTIANYHGSWRSPRWARPDRGASVARGLAGAVRTEETGQPARLGGEAEPVHREGVAEGLAQTPDLDARQVRHSHVAVVSRPAGGSPRRSRGRSRRGRSA